jgi:hypothetical protein
MTVFVALRLCSRSNRQGLAMAELSPAPIDMNIYLLTDHLDAALALGEDLCQQRVLLYPVTPGTGEAALLRQQGELSAFVSTAYTLELGLTVRLLQARKRIADLRQLETRFRPYFSGFIGGTAALVDAVEGFGHAGSDVYRLGAAPLVFMASRGLVAADASRLPENIEIRIDGEYRVAGGIPLGPLMDMLGSFLDGLELAFELYPNELYPKEAEALGDGVGAPASLSPTMSEPDSGDNPGLQTANTAA